MQVHVHVFHSYIHLYNTLQSIPEKTNFLQERFPIITVIFVLIPTIPLSFSFLCLLQLAVCMLYNPTALPEKIKFICKKNALGNKTNLYATLLKSSTYTFSGVFSCKYKKKISTSLKESLIQR